MSWKCPQCGVENADDKRTCEACGYVKFGVLTLASDSGKQVKMTIDTDLGRRLLQTFGTEDHKFASEPQYRIYKDAKLGGWAVQPAPGAQNPTFYNGAALGAEAVLLKAGDVLSIGPEKMKLSVQLTDG